MSKQSELERNKMRWWDEIQTASQLKILGKSKILRIAAKGREREAVKEKSNEEMRKVNRKKTI